MKISNCLTALVLCLLPVVSYAETDAEVEKNIRHALQTLLPEESVTRVRATPFTGLYEVLLGPNVIYVSADGRFILRGDLLDMQDRKNLSEGLRAQARKEIFGSLSADKYIEFSPQKPEHIVYVFTDIDCSYCRRLHRDVPVLNQGGVGVRYLAYPRAGPGSPASNIMEAVWCAADRQQALTDAKNGKDVVSRQCPNPVKDEYLLGQRFGVRGTPAIYTEDGEELSGYVPPAELLKIVNQ